MSMNAAPVIAAGFREWFDQVASGSTHHDSVDGYVVGALRVAVGGGPVVILEDGTLATLELSGSVRPATSLTYCLVPVAGDL